MITFKQIEAFRAVMLTGTTTEAAKMLKVTQPAISRLVSALEVSIGYNLFDREGRRVVATQEADQLIDEVRKAFIGLDRIREIALELGKTRYSRLRLVSVPSASSTHVVDMISIFAESNPDTRVTLEVMASDSTLEWVLSQQCDLGIASSAVESPVIQSCTIHVGDSVCILPVGHPLCAADCILPDMLEEESFISFCGDAAYRREIDEIFKVAGVNRILSYEARTTEAVCGLVSAGLGVSIVGPLPPTTSRHRAQTQNFEIRPFKPAPSVTLSLIWPTNRALSASAKEFIKVVRKHFNSP